MLGTRWNSAPLNHVAPVLTDWGNGRPTVQKVLEAGEGALGNPSTRLQESPLRASVLVLSTQYGCYQLWQISKDISCFEGDRDRPGLVEHSRLPLTLMPER